MNSQYINLDGEALTQDESGVFRTQRVQHFSYSDGRSSEAYLTGVFKTTANLSSESVELEAHAKDWASEYHLSRKRSQLLSPFVFPPNANVLEIGCGCGSITRLLGERFERVVAIEGSYARARLARLRCKDLPNVDVLCSPFQKIEFAAQFDYVFCIGVFEYSGLFVGGDNPYEEVLKKLAKALKPDGTLVVAIENKFGSKYFANSTEDHTNRMFEGLEDYPLFGNTVRTFGKFELLELLNKHFANTKFYHPYPDYKIPELVLSEELLVAITPWELIGGIRSRDYSYLGKQYFSERLFQKAIAKNNLMSFFSNSFLVFAGNHTLPTIEEGADGVLFSSGRALNSETKTYFIRDRTVGGETSFTTKKLLRHRRDYTQKSEPIASLSPVNSNWISGTSLQHLIVDNILQTRGDWTSVTHLVKKWKILLDQECKSTNGKNILPGNYLDATWRNCIDCSKGLRFFDLEWISNRPLTLEQLFIRSATIMFSELSEHPEGRKILRRTSARNVVGKLAKSVGITIDRNDWYNWERFERKFLAENSNSFGRTQTIGLWIQQHSFGLFQLFQFARKAADLLMRILPKVLRAVFSRLGRKFGL